ncbi:MAG: hypothetical protein M3Q73_02650 [bacterium]|nr:hypothetical protein [bacterium]
MISKHTSFFDKSLRFLTDKDREAFECATKMHDDLVQLIRLISVSQVSDITEEQNGAELVSKIDGKQGEKIVPGMVMGREFANNLLDATQKAYRLETVMEFLVNEESERNVKPREMVVTFHFFGKAAKIAHFWLKFYFADDGYVYHVEDPNYR